MDCVSLSKLMITEN